MMHKKPTATLLLCAAIAVSIPDVSSALAEDQPSSDPAARPDESEPTWDPDDLDDLGLLELEIPTVTTAARHQQDISTIPQAVTVITAEDIRRSGARSVPDALRLVPGMDVADLLYGAAAVSPRGFHGFANRQVLVLVDGRQLYDSAFGGTLWGAWPLQIEDIARIEIVRGPGGVTWGANALNGVVNIITKDPKDQLGLTVTSGGGSRGSLKQHVGYAFEDERLRIRVSGEYEASDGFLRGGSFVRGLEDDFKAGRIGLYAIFDASPDETFTLSIGNGTLDGGFAPAPTAGIGTRKNPGAVASHILGSWTRQTGNGGELELTGYVNDFQGSAGFSALDYRYQQLALQVRKTTRPTEGHVLTWGVDGRVDLLDGSNADPYLLSRDFVRTAIVGAYVQDDWQFAPRWALSLGGRLDYESYGGFQPSARAALSFAPNEKSLLYGAVSRAAHIHPPGLRFLEMPLLNELAVVTGRRDLKPETVVAYELGYRVRPTGNLEANANLFWHEAADMSTASPTLGPPGLLRFDIDTRADSSLYGAELDAKYRVSEQLTVLGHYSYQRLNWRSSVPFHEKELISPPEHKFMVGVRYDATDDLHLSGHLYYVDNVKTPDPINPFGPKPVDSYFRLDLRGEYEFHDDHASIAVGVRNLLDSHHYEGSTLFLNDAEVPRMFYAEFRLAIK